MPSLEYEPLPLFSLGLFVAVLGLERGEGEKRDDGP